MGPAPRRTATRRATDTLGAWRSDGAARWLFIWPAVLLILALSLFPLVASVALSVSKLAFNQGGVDLDFIGFFNYQQLLFGLERSHFLGVLKPPTPLGWAILIGTVALAGGAWVRAARSGQVRPVGLVLRLVGGVFLFVFVGLLVQTLAQRRRPARVGGRHAHLRVRRDRPAVRPGPRAGDARRPAGALAALLPDPVPDPADDHARSASATCS